jgi:hypothetical protein
LWRGCNTNFACTKQNKKKIEKKKINHIIAHLVADVGREHIHELGCGDDRVDEAVVENVTQHLSSDKEREG